MEEIVQEERKLVTIRKIAAILPIEGADAIEVAQVDDWKVVVKKGEFKVGEHCVYFEIDSWIPHDLAPFLSKGQEPKVYQGITGNKLRTVKLRGQISQGLILPLRQFDRTEMTQSQTIMDCVRDIQVVLGNEAGLTEAMQLDFSELLGVVKWEAEIPPHLAGQVKGAFPSFIRRTDQARCQNIGHVIFAPIDYTAGVPFGYERTMKLDGTSVTYYHNYGVVGACSRNLELKINEENKDNTIIKMLVDSGLDRVLAKMGNVAIQGELMGPGIQKNREGLRAHKFFIFDVQALDLGEYLTPEARVLFMMYLDAEGVDRNLVTHVPILGRHVTLEEVGATCVDDLLKLAEGPSIVHPIREGEVWKREDGKFSFKAISNLFCLKEKD